MRSFKQHMATAATVAALGLSACAPLVLGRPFQTDPRTAIKVGHDSKADVLRKMGAPYRRSVDSEGHEMLVYVFADGKGEGQKCVVAFNKNDVAYVVEVAP